jgi:hypothetical protein
MAPCFAAMMMPKSPSHHLNHRLSPVMRVEDKEKPAYLLGYAYARAML